MLKRYHVINVGDLRTAALRGAAYSGRAAHVLPLRAGSESPVRTRWVRLRICRGCTF